MCHCKCSVRIHVKICERSMRILVKIWNALSCFISCNWQVSLVYSLLNFFCEFALEYESFFIAFVWYYTIYSIVYTIYKILCTMHNILYIIYCILYIIYWIQIQHFPLYSNTIPMYYSNTMSKLLEPTLYFYILNPPLPWQWLWDNNPSSFLQACPSKYLIKHERVKNYKWCVIMDTLLIIVQTNTHKDLKSCHF
jgi:hypothetical protein